jgi:hypothetical protein
MSDKDWRKDAITAILNNALDANAKGIQVNINCNRNPLSYTMYTKDGFRPCVYATEYKIVLRWTESNLKEKEEV